MSAIVVGQDAAALVKNGTELTSAGKYQEALTSLDQAVAKDPELMDAYVKRAFVYSMLKDYEKNDDKEGDNKKSKNKIKIDKKSRKNDKNMSEKYKNDYQYARAYDLISGLILNENKKHK